MFTTNGSNEQEKRSSAAGSVCLATVADLREAKAAPRRAVGFILCQLQHPAELLCLRVGGCAESTVGAQQAVVGGGGYPVLAELLRVAGGPWQRMTMRLWLRFAENRDCLSVVT